MFSRPPQIELICIGTELLADKVNTNANAVAKHLHSIGLSLSRTITVGDSAKEIQLCLKESLKRADVVITCGGLGPTFDDLTRECVSKVLKKPLLFSEKILSQIKKKFEAANKLMPQENERQAWLIEGALPIANSVGTAPGQMIPLKNKCVIILPGPPSELEPMLRLSVLPYLKKKYRCPYRRTLVLHLFGVFESEADQKIRPITEKNWDQKKLKVIFGILAHGSIVDIKVTVEGSDRKTAQETLKQIKKQFYQILGDHIYGEDEETLESVVGALLARRKETLSIAESCTGGLVANKISNVPGSSNYFKEGIVSYSNESKIRLLGVKKKTLKKFGAVSRETAEEMSRGILEKSKSDWSIAVTGIAGPGGGSREKPVGLVHFSVSSKKGTDSTVRTFFGSRTEIKEKAALTALSLLRQKIKAA